MKIHEIHEVEATHGLCLWSLHSVAFASTRRQVWALRNIHIRVVPSFGFNWWCIMVGVYFQYLFCWVLDVKSMHEVAVFQLVFFEAVKKPSI